MGRKLLRVSADHSYERFQSIKMESSLGLVQQLEYSGEQGIQVSELNEGLVLGTLVKCNFGDGLESGITSQLVL